MRVLYLVRGEAGEDRRDFSIRIREFADGNLINLADSAVLAISDLKKPAWSVIPFRSDLMALISLDRVAEGSPWPKIPPGFAGAYLSEVAYPVVHTRNWPLGERSPGAGLLTLFRRKRAMEENEFLRRWYEGHTPLTLEVHPNVGYVRNRVLGRCYDVEVSGSDDYPNWDGIVEEQYDPAEDLTKASRFFGGSVLQMVPTMVRVLKDVRGFIDYTSIETWITSEYRLK